MFAPGAPCGARWDKGLDLTDLQVVRGRGEEAQHSVKLKLSPQSVSQSLEATGTLAWRPSPCLALKKAPQRLRALPGWKILLVYLFLLLVACPSGRGGCWWGGSEAMSCNFSSLSPSMQFPRSELQIGSILRPALLCTQARLWSLTFTCPLS